MEYTDAFSICMIYPLYKYFIYLFKSRPLSVKTIIYAVLYFAFALYFIANFPPIFYESYTNILTIWA